MHGWSILLGAVLVVLLVPTVLWLDRGVIANSLETQAPNPLGVGLLVALVAVNALVAALARRRAVRPATLLVLYVMLSVSLPFCSVGVISPMIGSIQAAAREMFWRGSPAGVLHIYTWQRPDYFPKLEPQPFERYLALRDPDSAAAASVVDAKAESLNLVRPLKQFWVGADVTRDVKARYANPGWTATDRLRAAWGDIAWPIWRPVLLNWGAFVALLFAGLTLIGRLLYRDWTERENLPFPAAQLPLALIEGRSEGADRPVARNPFFLGGLAVAVLLLLLSGLAHYRIADLPVDAAVTFQRIDFNAILVREPFSFIKNNYLFLSPLLVGVGFMVHQDILRGTLWVFGALQLTRLFTSMFEPSFSRLWGPAWRGNKWPYYPELATGAAVVFAAVLLWRSRAALRPHFRFRISDFRLGSGPRTGSEIGNRKSEIRNLKSLLLLAVLAAIAAWWWRMGLAGAGGVFVVFMVLTWGFAVAVALTRCRTEGGLAATGTTAITNKVLAPGIGYATHLAPANVKALAHGEWMAIAALPGLLAAQIEGYFMAHRLNVRARTVTAAAVVSFAVSLAVGLLSYMVLAYLYGGMPIGQRFYSGMAICMWNMGGDLVHRKAAVDGLWCAAVVLGGVLMAALLALRKRYPAFPLPPICLLIVCMGTVVFQTADDSLHPAYGTGPYVCFIWGPFFIAWLAKKLILRFGGMDLYVRATPAAHGLICGQCLMIVFWNVYHLVVQPENIGVFTGVFQ